MSKAGKVYRSIKAKTVRIMDNSPMQYLKRPLFTVSGNRELIAQGDVSVDEYGENRIVMMIGKMKITICGRGLMMCFYNRYTVKLTGVITDINFYELQGEDA